MNPENLFSEKCEAPLNEAELSLEETQALEVVSSLIDLMGFEAEYSLKKQENRFHLTLSSPQKSILIGRQGNTLEALQYLANIIYRKKYDQAYKIVIDVNGYRSNKQLNLIEQVEFLIRQVRRTGQPEKMPQLNAFDRRTIHLYIGEQEDLISYSEGEGLYKNVYLALKNPADFKG